MVRESNIIQIIGETEYARLRKIRCLLVGAGGIGSELLKDLILMNFGEISVVDLDTIDLSNLNRQFLFRQKDIKKSKSSVAVKAVEHCNNSKLQAYQGNIMDTKEFPLHWFDQFDILFNALDNLAARRYVNKISQFLKKPLIESGTAGFDGYIQPIIPGQSECFDCTSKETPKTYPVCTIRSTPSQPVHCVVWAKDFLFNQLFNDLSEGEGQEGETSKDWGSDDVDEIKRIQEESQELKELQDIVRSGDMKRVTRMLEKLFVEDIAKLLKIENLWKNGRTKPVALAKENLEGEYDETLLLSVDQVGTLEEQIAEFINSSKRLMKRLIGAEANAQGIEFDKDDEDTLRFVSSASNIRSLIFGIPVQSIFDIKKIAGNIIPAVASTNGIIAGLSSLISLRVLQLLPETKDKGVLDINMAFTSKASNISNDRYLSNPKLARPNCKCVVCSRVLRGVVKMSDDGLKEITLGGLVEELRGKYDFPEDISLMDTQDQRLLIDYDFDDLQGKTLGEMGLKEGSVLLFSDEMDEDQIRKPIELYLSMGQERLVLPDLPAEYIEGQTPVREEEEPSEISANADANDGVIILDDDLPEDNQLGDKRPLDSGDDADRKRVKIGDNDDGDDDDDNDDVIELD
ncbi:hypothetical protein TBLA_0A07950 [Henningerozyma blattae CBS 6284]|uniref:Ubiquitin-activating enzyme E1-like n=1 Tax=Henningerozyma blattae (strain ATCC 34711 / CBS 6284 / DSM 70876 / NBRC 10599 / NRRL Y-10934 / UCD 77-7) TaxID=1071380 RepID=I2GWT3_HENB6|nr:hypothetical protein TBLA_0A07950 [Tetrapisispora blattae CBS 6284]CCH58585.1 hypothetical protein TBLA_0A07950 [Tetrapisispora blattae CBS 6284]